MSPPTTYNNGGGGNSGSAMSTVPNASNKTQSSIVSLMYHTRSGLLVTSEELASSMSRKYWFAAALGCAVFGGIMAMVGSSRDAATYTDTPF